MDGQLRHAGNLWDQNIITPIHGSEYWVEQMRWKLRLMGTISKALIDSGVMISLMSKGYCG